MAGKLDARAKLASTLCALFLVASTPFAAKPNPLSSKEAERKERKDRKKKTIHAD